MKITEHLNSAERTLFSFEVLPPLKGQNISSLFDHMDPLMEFDPPFVDVTYHREEYVYKKRDNGLLQRRTVRKRPGTVGICAAIQNKYKVDAVPHIICGGFTREETENALIDLNFLGIDNLLLLQGDTRAPEKRFVPEPDGNEYASDLIEQVVDLNNGRYLDDEIQNPTSADFCIGVAGYPEKHYAAPNLDTDLNYLKKKVDLGAEYIVTQMFFDNSRYFDFVEKCREKGIDVPIIPGIKPVTSKKHNSILPQMFHVDLPYDLSKELESCEDNDAAKEVGIEWAIQQCRELIEYGVPVVHFYSMGRSTPVYQVAKALF